MGVDPDSERLGGQTYSNREAARYLGRAIGTLLITPPHERLYRELKREDEQLGVIVPVHPDIALTLADMQPALARTTRAGEPRTGQQLCRLAALLMQFGNHFPSVPPELRVEYDKVSDLHERITQEGVHSDRRLTLGDQLNAALDQADGAFDQGLHTLFVTSRFYARWLDETTIRHLPAINTEERLGLMRAWQESLLGFKSGQQGYHDTAGDTYYAWTHAYAGYAFEQLRRRKALATELGRVAFEHGTVIMQTCVNNLNPRGTISDHTIAARYGNAVARACVQAVKE